jgi:GMP synthase (glutamine-hydrolysing)
MPVLHWHGDTFDIPKGAQYLAATNLCRNQAFAIGNNILAVQFHPEVDPSLGLEQWLMGHAAELAAAKISPASLRAQAIENGSVLRDAARAMISSWLAGLG